MYVTARRYLAKLLTKEALNVLVADDFDIFSGRSGRLAYDGGTVLFTVGLTVTDATGHTGVVAAIIGDATSGILLLNDCSGLFHNNDVLTDSGSGAAVVDGTLGPHEGHWTGFSIIEQAAFVAITTGEGAKENVSGRTFSVNFKCIADIVAMQLASGAIMAHKIEES